MSDKTFDTDASDRRPVIKIKPVSAFSFGFKEDRYDTALIRGRRFL
jgi:hypothetical protein